MKKVTIVPEEKQEDLQIHVDNAGQIPVVDLDTEIKHELKAEGEARDIVRKIQEERKMIGTKLDERVNVTIESYPESFVEYIRTNALVEELSNGIFKVEKISS